MTRSERAKRQWADPECATKMRVGLAKTMWRKSAWVAALSPEKYALRERLRKSHFKADEIRRIVEG